MSGRSGLVIGVLVLGLLLLASSMVIIKEYERGLQLRLGEMVAADLTPGLHFKLPLVDSTRTFDARLQTLDIPPERFLTEEKKNLIVDFFVKWRIDDVARFYRATGGSMLQTEQRLEQIVKDGLRSEFGKRTVQEAVSGERRQIMDNISVAADDEAVKLGINVEEVRIKRIDLPTEVSESVYARMEAERARTAKELRAEGEEAAERIRAGADRERSVIIAEAHRDAERTRGAGDATAASIYAEAYAADREFYRFHRSLQAYRTALTEGKSVLVLEPGSEFFRYFRSPDASASTQP